MSAFSLGKLERQVAVTTNSGGTKVLVADSPELQVFDGDDNHAVRLPDATTMKVGVGFYLKYQVSGSASTTLTIQLDDASTLRIIRGAGWDFLVCTDNSTSNGEWASLGSLGMDNLSLQSGFLGIGAFPAVPLDIATVNATANLRVTDSTYGARIRTVAGSVNFDTYNSGAAGFLITGGSEQPIILSPNSTEKFRVADDFTTSTAPVKVGATAYSTPTPFSTPVQSIYSSSANGLHIYGDGTNAYAALFAFRDNNAPSDLRFYKARGSLASPAAAQNNDIAGYTRYGVYYSGTQVQEIVNVYATAPVVGTTTTTSGWYRTFVKPGTGTSLLEVMRQTGTQNLGAYGTAAAPGFAFIDDEDTGVSRSGADTLSISTGGTERLSVSTTAAASTLPFTAPNIGTVTQANSAGVTPAASGSYVAIASITLDAGTWLISGTAVLSTDAAFAYTASGTNGIAISTGNTSVDAFNRGNFKTLDESIPGSRTVYADVGTRIVTPVSSTTYYLLGVLTYSVLGGSTIWGTNSYIGAVRLK